MVEKSDLEELATAEASPAIIVDEKRPADVPGVETQIDAELALSPVSEVVYPNSLQSAIISVSLCLCVFLVGLVRPPQSYSLPLWILLKKLLIPTGQDSTILTTAVPRITDQFGSIDDVGWYDAAL